MVRSLLSLLLVTTLGFLLFTACSGEEVFNGFNNNFNNPDDDPESDPDFEVALLSNGADQATSTQHTQDSGTGSVDFFLALYDDGNCEFKTDTDAELASDDDISRSVLYACTYQASGTDGIDIRFDGEVNSNELLQLTNIVVGSGSFAADVQTADVGPFSYDQVDQPCNIDDAPGSGSGCT